MKRRTIGSHRRKPPIAASRASCGVTRDSGESKLARDEAVELQLVEPGQPLPQSHIAFGFLGPGEALDLSSHCLGIAVYVQAAAIGERGVVRRQRPAAGRDSRTWFRLLPRTFRR